MPKINETKRNARRKQIMDAATRQALKRGMSQMTIADISQEAGLSVGAIYTHFKNKETILLDICAQNIDTITNEIASYTKKDVTEEPLQLARTILSSFSQYGIEPKLIVQVWGLATTDRSLQNSFKESYARMKSVILEYVTAWNKTQRLENADAEAEHKTAYIMMVTYDFILQSAICPDFDARVYFDQLMAGLNSSSNG